MKASKYDQKCLKLFDFLLLKSKNNIVLKKRETILDITIYSMLISVF